MKIGALIFSVGEQATGRASASSKEPCLSRPPPRQEIRSRALLWRKYLRVYSIKAIKCKCCHPVQRITICSWNLFFINTKNTKELAASGPEGFGLMKQLVLSKSGECTMAVYLPQPPPPPPAEPSLASGRRRSESGGSRNVNILAVAFGFLPF